jgi:hypothetical protein
MITMKERACLALHYRDLSISSFNLRFHQLQERDLAAAALYNEATTLNHTHSSHSFSQSFGINREITPEEE